MPVLPLTPEAFASFGKVIQAYSEDTAVPRGTKVTYANGNTARKFHKLALMSSSYPEDSHATLGLSVYRCSPVTVQDGFVDVKVLERHRFTTQAFVPMGGGVTDGVARGRKG